MVYQLVIPAMDSAQELRVLEWHKAERDVVEADDLLVELETSKAVVEVRSPRACVLRKIEVAQGGWATAGPAIAWFSDTADEPLLPGSGQDLVPRWTVI
jgi:pyruvate/2-oxoglutarate dehydrogenase complex dihydrolipoamide acyltransferase (E2) component